MYTQTTGPNHLTVWNRLKSLGKTHKEVLLQMGFHFEVKFNENNGAGGKIPILPQEWRDVGIDSDQAAWNLLEFAYRVTKNLKQ